MFRSFAIVLVSTFMIAANGTLFAGKVIEKAESGSLDLKSINVISFAPEGVLLVGDGRGGQILAVETGDIKGIAGKFKTLVNIDQELAARVGAPPKGIEIIDMAVNPASGMAYIATRKQDDKSSIIFTVAPSGKIGLLDLDKARYVRIKLATEKGSVSLITDVAWAGTQIVAAARSNETFSSKIFSIPAPLSKQTAGQVFSAETYHVSHGRWETKAPMSALIPIKEKDVSYIVGAFSCTPVVKYRIDSIKPGATVKGSSMIELGSGNRPLDMFAYEKDGKPFVLANTFRFHHARKPFGPSPYWTVKFEQGLLAGSEAVNDKAVRRLKGAYQPATDRIEMVEAYHGVMQMDRLGLTHSLAVRDTGKGLELVALPLP
jgi:hypothetical protein